MFEQPLTATSWEMDVLKHLAGESAVMATVFDMCQFGMCDSDSEGEGLVRKSTQVLTNVESVADALSLRCEGGHRHVHLLSGKAKAAAVYPAKMCEAVIKGLRMWMGRAADVRGRELLEFSRPDLCDPSECELCDDSGGYYLDDLKGERLDSKLARKARMEEIEVFKERQVYEIVPRASMPRGKRVIGVRWVPKSRGWVAR